ncbi:MAG: enoyl-CoA hydratase-related protein [Pseudomonadota bacterium]
MTSYNTIECEVNGRIVTVTLNRPNKLNAISFEMQNELVTALEEAAADPNIHVVIIQGAGRAFSAGYDITTGSTGGGGVPRDRSNIELLMRNWLRIWDLPIPVIGKVRGYCLAGATQLAAICDITFAANEAKIGTPQLPLGAGFVGSVWAWFVGPKKAKEMFFPTGEIISGAEATEWGLFNRAVPDAELDEAVAAYAAKVAKTPREILELHKKSFNRIQEIQGFREALLQSVEIDAIAHAGPAVKSINKHIKENGLQETFKAFNRGEVP